MGDLGVTDARLGRSELRGLRPLAVVAFRVAAIIFPCQRSCKVTGHISELPSHFPSILISSSQKGQLDSVQVSWTYLSSQYDSWLIALR